MTQENGNNIKLGDIATILTISSILLYFLGWSYWSSYFSSLNIDSSFIDMTIDRLITTTWYLILFVMLGFYMTYYYMMNTDKENKINVIYAMTSIIFSLLSIVWFTKKIDTVFYFSFLFFNLIVSMVIIKVLRKKNISPKIISMRLFVYILTSVIYVTSIFYYKDLGQKHANEFKINYNENIELLLIHNDLLVKGKLIVYMNNKFFILTKENDTDVVCIYNDSDILQTKILD